MSLVLLFPFPAPGYAEIPGHLQAPRNYRTGPVPVQAVPLDLDGDGDLDLAVRRSEPSGAKLELVENRGQGDLQTVAVLALAGPFELSAGDLNGDGLLDLVQGSPEGTLRIFRNQGEFGFSSTDLAVGFPAVQLCIGELDGTNGADLALGNDGAIKVYLADGAGGFIAGGQYDTDAENRDYDQDGIVDSQVISIADCLCGDPDRDGDDDLIVVNALTRTIGLQQYQTTEVVSLANLGAGVMGPYTILLSEGGGKLGLADLDGNGYPEVATTAGQDLVVLRNQGQMVFGAPERYSLSQDLLEHGLENLRLGDLGDTDSDGFPDIALLAARKGSGEEDPLPDKWLLLKNQGGGGAGTLFSLPEVHPAGAGAQSLAMAELDGEPGPEVLVTAADDHRLSVSYNQGGQGYAFPTWRRLDDPRYPLGKAPIDAAGGDFNHDGWYDLGVLTRSALPAVPDTLLLLPGGPGGTLGAPLFLEVPAGAARLLMQQIADTPAAELATLHVEEAPGLGLGLGVEQGLPAPLGFTPLLGTLYDFAYWDLEADGGPGLAVLQKTADGVPVINTFRVTDGGDLLDPVEYVVGGAYDVPEVITSADLDNDGKKELLAVVEGYLPQLDSGFSVLAEVDGGPYVSQQLLVFDVSGDGMSDLLLLESNPVLQPGEDSSRVVVLLNRGGNVYGQGTAYEAGSGSVVQEGRGATRMQVAEVDDVPGPEILVATDISHELILLLNDGSGHFDRQERYLTGGSPRALVTADWNQDSLPEVAVCQAERLADSTVLASVALLAPQRQIVLPGDFNGDCRVNLSDFNILKAHWLQTGPDIPGDANGDGRVNLSDFNMLKANWLMTCD